MKVINSEALKAKIMQRPESVDLSLIEEVIEETPQVSTVDWGMSYEVIQAVLLAEATDLMTQGKFEGARALCDMADYFGCTIPKMIQEAKRGQEEV